MIPQAYPLWLTEDWQDRLIIGWIPDPDYPGLPPDHWWPVVEYQGRTRRALVGWKLIEPPMTLRPEVS